MLGGMAFQAGNIIDIPWGSILAKTMCCVRRAGRMAFGAIRMMGFVRKLPVGYIRYATGGFLTRVNDSGFLLGEIT